MRETPNPGEVHVSCIWSTARYGHGQAVACCGDRRLSLEIRRLLPVSSLFKSHRFCRCSLPVFRLSDLSLVSYALLSLLNASTPPQDGYKPLARQAREKSLPLKLSKDVAFYRLLESQARVAVRAAQEFHALSQDATSGKGARRLKSRL